MIPYNDYFEYFGPEHKLKISVSNMENMNTKRYLEDIKMQVLQILGNVSPPSTQIHTGQDGTTLIPSAPMDVEEDEKIATEMQLDKNPNAHVITNHDLMEQNATQ